MKTILWILLVTLAGVGDTAAVAPDQRAPEFTGISHWINSKPLTMAGLRGKVVLIDYWAYSCINCLRAMPHVEKLYEEYKDKGLVIVGVHSPEFEFEKVRANVENAVVRLGITYPVAIDNELATWNAWQNQYWPAEYLVDQQGNLIGHKYGEGGYLRMENAVRLLLGMDPRPASTGSTEAKPPSTSPEMFLGAMHLKNLASPEGRAPGTRRFTAPARLALDRFALVGRWEIAPQYAHLVGERGELRLRFTAGKLHIVASADAPLSLEVLVDGRPQPPITVQASRLYTLFDSNDYREHTLILRIPRAGLRAYTFTFG